MVVQIQLAIYQIKNKTGKHIKEREKEKKTLRVTRLCEAFSVNNCQV
jgi:hypothetical protein